MNRSRSTLTLVPLIALLLLLLGTSGCDNNESPTSATPVTGVDISPEEMQLEISRTVEIAATVSGGQSQALQWYVNDVLGGNATIGLVTQTNPAIYTSPDSVPTPAAVILRAVSGENPAYADTCAITIAFTVAYVNVDGDDATGSGGHMKPFGSITRALAAVSAGMTISLAPGTYDRAGGEEFPLVLPEGIALVGDDWVDTVIRCNLDGTSLGYAIQVAGADCALRKFTLEQSDGVTENWTIGIYLLGSADRAHVDSVRILERPQYGSLRIWHPEDVLVENCRFVVDDGETEGHGIELHATDENTIVRDCTISGFHAGFTIQNLSNPLIERCTFENNTRAMWAGFQGETGHDANPDLGGGARGGTGGNIIRNNTECGLWNESTNTIYAIGNTWGNDPPVDGEDYCNQFGGTVIWQE